MLDQCKNLEIVIRLVELYLKIMFFEACDVLLPENGIFMHGGPIEVSKEDFLLKLIERTELLDVLFQPLFQLVQGFQKILKVKYDGNISMTTKRLG